jgi:spermidine synthase
MATFEAGVRVPPSMPSALRLAPALYAATLFVSALLLFAVQPMFAKMVLPRLGGAPAVWSVAMVFFQGALLAGYAYAHLLCRLLPPGRAALVHLAVLAAAALTLPIGVAAGFDIPPQSGVAFWLVSLFAASIGLPFVALAASAPLLQHWFAASGHAQARNPYVLYAASNLGSFTALLAYPFVLEPLLRLSTQARLWSVAFAALALLVAAAALMVARRESADATAGAAADAPPSSWADRLRWMALAAVPSGLVVAVTSFVTTDVAAAPFLWVIPLAIYLATFVAVFRERPWFDHATVARLAPLVVAPVAVTLLGSVKPHWIAAIAFNLLTFVILTLVCHGELYRRRPAAAHLTEFYLWISLGGALGGAFAGLIAPYAFNDIYEYPILIAGGLLALPGFFAGGRAALLRQAGPVLALAACVPIARMAGLGALSHGADGAAKIAAALVLILIVLRRKQPAAVFGLVVFAFVFTGAWRPTFDHVATVRSFFGVHRVLETAGGGYRVLMHGTTMHGAMRLRGDDGAALTGRPAPLTYYYEGSPIAEAVAATRAEHGLHDVAVVGLGAGSLGCYRKNAENWTFYEIDPQVVRIARDPHLFRFLSDCAPSAAIVLGDARLTLAAAHTRHDLIVLDAFSSDAIPVHLLTQEAFAIYFTHLTPHGVLVIHTSNRHLDLAPALAAAAKAAGLVAFTKEKDQGELLTAQYKASSSVVVMARKRADLGALPARPGWQPLTPATSVPVWTDDYSDILRAMRWEFAF